MDILYHYKPDSYEDEAKKWYTLWSLEFPPDRGYTYADFEKAGFTVLYEPKQPKYVKVIDLYEYDQHAINEAVTVFILKDSCAK